MMNEQKQDKVYYIPNWLSRFETAKSRKYKTLPWIAYPTSLTSDEYIEVVTREDNIAVIAGWMGVLLVAAHCNPDRGILVRANGKAYTPQSLSVATRLPVSLFEETLPTLVELGMLAASEGIPDKSVLGTLQDPDEVASGPLHKHNIDIDSHKNDNSYLNPDSHKNANKNQTQQDKTGTHMEISAINSNSPDELEKLWRNSPDPEASKHYRQLCLEARQKVQKAG